MLIFSMATCAGVFYSPRFQVDLNGRTLEVKKGRITNLDGNQSVEDFLAAN
jgi:hypothetical protein